MFLKKLWLSLSGLEQWNRGNTLSAVINPAFSSPFIICAQNSWKCQHTQPEHRFNWRSRGSVSSLSPPDRWKINKVLSKHRISCILGSLNPLKINAKLLWLPRQESPCPICRRREISSSAQVNEDQLVFVWKLSCSTGLGMWEMWRVTQNLRLVLFFNTILNNRFIPLTDAIRPDHLLPSFCGPVVTVRYWWSPPVVDRAQHALQPHTHQNQQNFCSSLSSRSSSGGSDFSPSLHEWGCPSVCRWFSFRTGTPRKTWLKRSQIFTLFRFSASIINFSQQLEPVPTTLDHFLLKLLYV